MGTQTAESLKTLVGAFGEADEQRLLVATHNAGKLGEYKALLCNVWAGGLVSAGEMNLSSPEETGRTFEANAMLKADAALKGWNGWVLADDSGLCVDALDGLPGVDTAYFGGWEKLLEAMRDVPDAKRSAHFVAVLVLKHGRHGSFVFRAEDHGMIATEGRGTRGFGYDPVFIPQGDTRTFAEMSAEEKAQTSHRAKAVRLLIGALKNG